MSPVEPATDAPEPVIASGSPLSYGSRVSPSGVCPEIDQTTSPTRLDVHGEPVARAIESEGADVVVRARLDGQAGTLYLTPSRVLFAAHGLVRTELDLDQVHGVETAAAGINLTTYGRTYEFADVPRYDAEYVAAELRRRLQPQAG